jgi:aspartate racemase
MVQLPFPAFDLRRVDPPRASYTAGILGGLAPQSTSLFYDTITQLCLRHYPQAYPRLLINSVDAWAAVRILDRRDLAALAAFLRHELGWLQDRCDFVVMVCNSVHAALAALRRELSIPVMAIHEEVAKEVALTGTRRVGVLGTRTTVASGLYQTELAAYGIEAVVLPPERVAAFDRFIFEEMLHGRFPGTMRRLIQEGIDSLVAAGCEGVVLGCTELPLFITQRDTEVPLFPSTQILARAVVDGCFGKW